MTAVDPATATTPATRGAIASALDSVGFTRAQFWVLTLIMAGEFFDTLEQNSVGAMGTNIKDSLHIGDVQLTTINTATVIGGLVGRLAAGWLADRYGRRFSLGLNLLVYTLGGLLSAVSFSDGMLLVSRFIVGIGVGGEFMIGIAMISEMVATRHRGTLVASINVGAGGVGNFVSYGLFLLLLGPLAVPLGGNGHVWRWSFVILAVPALFVVLYRRRLPESPRWLLSTGPGRRGQPLARHPGVALADHRQPGSPGRAHRGRHTARRSPRALRPRSSAASLIGRTAALGHRLLDGLRIAGHAELPDAHAAGRARLHGFAEPALHDDHERRLAARRERRGPHREPGRTPPHGHRGGNPGLHHRARVRRVRPQHRRRSSSSARSSTFFTMMTNTTLATWTPEVYPTSIRCSGSSITNGIGNIAGAVMPYAATALYADSKFAGVFGLAAAMYALLVIAARFAPEARGRTLEDVNENTLVAAMA